MAKKSKTAASVSDAAPTGKRVQTAKAGAKSGAAKSKPRAVKKVVAKKRASNRLSLTLPLARARKLAGDLYEAAGMVLWVDAIESAFEPKKSELIALQDSLCEAADFLREAKATNPKNLQLFWVACFDRHGLPSTEPCFITAADEDEAETIWRDAFKGEFGRRRPRAHRVPALAAAPGVHL